MNKEVIANEHDKQMASSVIWVLLDLLVILATVSLYPYLVITTRVAIINT